MTSKNDGAAADVSSERPVSEGDDQARSRDRRAADEVRPPTDKVKEIGGPKGPEPTRYGDWEKGGRCSDF